PGFVPRPALDLLLYSKPILLVERHALLCSIQLYGFDLHLLHKLQGPFDELSGKSSSLKIASGEHHADPGEALFIADDRSCGSELAIDFYGEASLRTEFQQRAPVVFGLVPARLRRKLKRGRNILDTEIAQHATEFSHGCNDRETIWRSA